MPERAGFKQRCHQSCKVGRGAASGASAAAASGRVRHRRRETQPPARRARPLHHVARPREQRAFAAPVDVAVVVGVGDVGRARPVAAPDRVDRLIRDDVPARRRVRMQRRPCERLGRERGDGGAATGGSSARRVPRSSAVEAGDVGELGIPPPARSRRENGKPLAEIQERRLGRRLLANENRGGGAEPFARRRAAPRRIVGLHGVDRAFHDRVAVDGEPGLGCESGDRGVGNFRCRRQAGAAVPALIDLFASATGVNSACANASW